MLLSESPTMQFIKKLVFVFSFFYFSFFSYGVSAADSSRHIDNLLSAPLDGSVVSGVVNISAYAWMKANTDIIKYSIIDANNIEIDSGVMSQVGGNNYSADWDTAFFADGSYKVLVTVNGTIFNNIKYFDFAYVDTNNLSADTEPPTVVMQSPLEGDTISGTNYRLSALVNENFLLSRTEFYLNGSLLTSVAPTSNTVFGSSYSMDVFTYIDVENDSRFINGTNQMRVVAVDMNGNQGFSSVVNFNVSKGSYTVSLWRDLMGVAVSDSGNFKFETNATQSYDTRQIDLYASLVGSNSAPVLVYSYISPVSLYANGTFVINFDSTTIGNGTYDFFTKVTSVDDKVATSNALRYSVNNPDLTAPTIPGSFVATSNSSSEIVLSWTASTDANGVAGYNVYRNGSATPISVLAGNAVSYSDTGLSQDKQYSYTINAFDSAGNVSNKTSPASAVTLGLPAINLVSWDSASANAGDTVMMTANVVNANGMTLNFEIWEDDIINDDPIRTIAGGNQISVQIPSNNELISIPWNVVYIRGDDITPTVEYIFNASVGNVNLWNNQQLSVSEPPDVTLPTVSLTSSSNEITTTNSSTTLRASAVDNVAIANVVFYADNTEIATDATSPYEVVWSLDPASVASSVVFKAIAYDTSGNSSIDSITIPINNTDTTAPSVTLSASLNPGESIVDPINISAVASDFSGIDRVVFYVNNSEILTDTTAPYEVLAWSPDPSLAGTNVSIGVVAYDASGNSSSDSLSLNVAILDVTPPVITITSPSENGSVAGIINISADVVDVNSGVSKVEFYVNGSLLKTDTTAPYSAGWDSSLVADGMQAIRVTAYDGSFSNNNTSQTININVVNSENTVSTSNTDPSTGMTTTVVTTTDPSTGNVTITTTITKPSTDGSGVPVVVSEITVTKNLETGIITTPLILDTEAPTIPSNLIANTVSDTQIDLAWAASSDNSGVVGYKIFRDGGVEPIADIKGTETKYSDKGLMQTTTYEYEVSAYDGNDNESAKSSLVTATTVVTPDTTIPVVSILSPKKDTVIQASSGFNISADASDNESIMSVEFFVDDVSIGVDSSYPYDMAWDTSNLSGVYSIYVLARDNSGNFAKSEKISVIVDRSGSAPNPVKGIIPVYYTTKQAEVFIGRVEFITVDSSGNESVFFVDKTFPYKANLDTRILANGNYSIKVKVYNENNFIVTESSLLTISVSN